MGRATILSKISTFILTGGRRTTASGTRDVLTEMADSYVSAIYDTAANFTSTNPVLETKQHGVETDGLTTTPKFKIGDGVTAWNDLPYTSGTSTLNSTYMLTGIASDISGYEQAVSLNNFVVGGLNINLVPGVSTTPTILREFATNLGFPNTTIIPSGSFTFHFKTKKSAGSNNYYCYAELYKRNLAGTETLLITSDNSSQSSVNTNIQHTLGGFSTVNIPVLSTDRLVIKIYAVMVSSTATISLFTDDNTDARFVIPSAYIGGGDFVKKGTLTTNYIPKATASDTIGDSQMSDNGANGIYIPTRLLVDNVTTYNSTNLVLSGSSGVDILSNGSTAISVSSLGVINTPKLTPSQILETDASKNLVSVAKQSGYNLPLGTTAGTVLEGSYFPQRETMVNADKTFSAGKTEVYLSASLTAPRVLTLPAASAFTAGTELIFVDEAGAISSTNYVTLTRVGSDLINGASTSILSVQYGTYRIITDGSSKWTLLNNTELSTGTWTPTVTGYSSYTVYYAKYSLDNNKRCTISCMITGTSNATTLTVTMPFNADGTITQRSLVPGTNATSTNVIALVATQSPTPTNILDCYASQTGAAWTNTGTKIIWITHTYTIQ